MSHHGRWRDIVNVYKLKISTAVDWSRAASSSYHFPCSFLTYIAIFLSSPNSPFLPLFHHFVIDNNALQLLQSPQKPLMASKIPKTGIVSSIFSLPHSFLFTWQDAEQPTSLIINYALPMCRESVAAKGQVSRFSHGVITEHFCSKNISLKSKKKFGVLLFLTQNHTI